MKAFYYNFVHEGKDFILDKLMWIQVWMISLSQKLFRFAYIIIIIIMGMNKLWMIFVLITEWNVMDRIQSEIIPGTFFCIWWISI